jgi:hypothetical protein
MKITNTQAQLAAKAWSGQAGGRLVPALTENELAGLVNEVTDAAEDALLKELRAARLAIQKLKAEFNEFDDGTQIAKAALRRVNASLKAYRRPVSVSAPIRPKE